MSFRSDITAFVRAMRHPSRVPRRDAYLFTWGVGYLLLAIYWLSDGFYWGTVFGFVGLLAIIAAITSSHSGKAFGFSFLAGTAILHAFSFIWPFPSLEVSMPRPMIIIWFVIAMSHVIIAGWPIHCLEHSHDITAEGHRHDA